MISSRQIKAARALLGWTQTDLAQASGLHFNAINKIENEIGEARQSSLVSIKSACEYAGIRFRGQRGVEFKEDVFETLRIEGKDFLSRMIDDILTCLRTSDDELLCCTPDEGLFNTLNPKQSDRYYERMRDIGFKERVITCCGYSSFAHNRKNYRWLPQEILGKVTYTLYSDRVVFTNWDIQESLIIRSKSLAETFRNQFEFLWVQANPFD